MENPILHQPEVTGFFDPRTGSVQYVAADPVAMTCAIIDPVHNFDEKSGQTTTANADHFSAAHYLKQKTGAPTAIGEKVIEMHKLWKTFKTGTIFQRAARNGTGFSPMTIRSVWGILTQG